LFDFAFKITFLSFLKNDGRARPEIGLPVPLLVPLPVLMDRSLLANRQLAFEAMSD
jgi:hypothetical protein